MNRLWDPFLGDLTRAVRPRLLVEIGSEHGLLTAKLLDYSTIGDAVVHAVDPAPQFDVGEWSNRYGRHFEFHQVRSLEVLDEIHGVDMAFIDGDHNWFTVYHELRKLEGTALTDGRVPPVVVLHDAGWPYGRRDMYYDPETIPEPDRQPHRKRGLLPGETDFAENGLNAGFNNAVSEGSRRNGVRTAIEDFIAESDAEWHVVYIPGFHGVAIIATNERISGNADVRDVLDSFQTLEFMTRRAEELELDRIRSDITVSQRAEELSAHVALLDSVRSELLKTGGALAAERRLTGVLQERAAGDEAVIARLESELAGVVASGGWRLYQRLRQVIYAALGGRDSLPGTLLARAVRWVGRLTIG
jgi:hypothetical protein